MKIVSETNTLMPQLQVYSIYISSTQLPGKLLGHSKSRTYQLLSILQNRLFAHLIRHQIFICSCLSQYDSYAEFQLLFLICISLDKIVLEHCQRINFFPNLTRFITLSWFTSASARTQGEPSASGYFLCICSVSDVQVHSRAAPCRSSSAHSSSHKLTNCHPAAQRNEQSSPI